MSMNGELRLIPPELMDQLDDEAVVEGLMVGDGISVGKAWNGLHYLYCGDGTAGESAISGGIPLDHGDTGYGPPQYLTPDEVATYARELEAMTDDRLRDAYDAKEMEKEGVYPGGWDDPSNLEWLLTEARSVREFYRDAAAKGAGVLQFLS
ncbi:MAG: YfbM family protein [Deltaproteobacteria bacterium]|nr:YfbM family protein [Kofleriaceae bacterium]